MADDIRAFIATNESRLKARAHKIELTAYIAAPQEALLFAEPLTQSTDELARSAQRKSDGKPQSADVKRGPGAGSQYSTQIPASHSSRSRIGDYANRDAKPRRSQSSLGNEWFQTLSNCEPYLAGAAH